MPLPWSATMDDGEVAFPLNAQPDLAAVRRVADRIADQVDEDLQGAGEVAGGGHRALIRAVDGDAFVGGAHIEQAGGAAGEGR